MSASTLEDSHIQNTQVDQSQIDMLNTDLYLAYDEKNADDRMESVAFTPRATIPNDAFQRYESMHAVHLGDETELQDKYVLKVQLSSDDVRRLDELFKVDILIDADGTTSFHASKSVEFGAYLYDLAIQGVHWVSYPPHTTGPPTLSLLNFLAGFYTESRTGALNPHRINDGVDVTKLAESLASSWTDPRNPLHFAGRLFDDVTTSLEDLLCTTGTVESVAASGVLNVLAYQLSQADPSRQSFIFTGNLDCGETIGVTLGPKATLAISFIAAGVVQPRYIAFVAP